MDGNGTKGPTDEDWDKAVADVRPLKPQAKLARPAPVAKRVAVRQRPAAVPVVPPGQRHEDGRQIDKGTEKRLKRGQVEIEGRLDLHGLSVAQAHQRLKDFVIAAQNAGKRCVLVVTGKGELPNPDGTPPSRGRIRREFPEWLASAPLNHLVLKTLQARPEDGGAGAVYLYLRRDRNR